MIPSNDIYVPNGWNKTSKIVPYNPSRSSWPEVSNINENIFDLSIVTHSKLDDDLMDCDENLTLFFVHQDNEIMLIEETSCKPAQLVDDKKENIYEGGTVKEKTYLLKVYDRETKSTMFYDVKLARVELEKEMKMSVGEENSLSEHLEVIAKLDEDNPFDTEFEDSPLEYSKNDD